MTNLLRTRPTSDVVFSNKIPRYVTMAGRCYSLPGVCEVKDRCLVAVESQQAEPLFPVWQFPAGRLLAHLPVVVSALPTERLGPWETAL